MQQNLNGSNTVKKSGQIFLQKDVRDGSKEKTKYFKFLKVLLKVLVFFTRLQSHMTDRKGNRLSFECNKHAENFKLYQVIPQHKRAIKMSKNLIKKL